MGCNCMRFWRLDSKERFVCDAFVTPLYVSVPMDLRSSGKRLVHGYKPYLPISLVKKVGFMLANRLIVFGGVMMVWLKLW